MSPPHLVPLSLLPRLIFVFPQFRLHSATVLPRRIGLIFLPLLLAGCVGSPNHLTFTPNRDSVEYRQQFNRCYVLREPAGDYHFFLVADGLHTPLDSPTDAPLQPAPVMPLRQIVHIHVFWRPMRGSKPDSPSATNASIDWYFIAHSGRPDQSVAHYQGGGFATVNLSTRSAAVGVRNMSIRLESISGSLRDALGSGEVTGNFVALLDPGEVHDLLSEINSLND
ncbi:MAG TPA: hypothetical protein VG722_09780 [Tepidisphaeraceae bacterium]|nr:hypothetical protein [Tepidisphaeraceae bacterium]